MRVSPPRRLLPPLLSLCLLLALPAAAPGQATRATVPESGLNAPDDMGRGADARPSTRPAAAAGPDVASATAGGLPVIRLTPRDVLIPGPAWRGRLDLAGAWDFALNVPDSFDGTYDSIASWDKATAPGHFSWQGLGEMHAEFGVPVAWHRTFEVPEAWDGLRVRLRFESADGLAKVYVNGDLVGTSERVNTPGEFDVTDALNGGTNELVVTLERTLATYWSKRTMGGLARGVYLQAVPPVSLARLHVSADLKSMPDDAGVASSADALAHLRVANDTAAPAEGMAVRFALADVGSQRVPIKLREPIVPLPPIPAGEMLEMTLPLPVADVRTWTAETPELYHLECELLDSAGEVVMRARQRFGFREIETRGGELLLNGTPIKMRGANYHMSYPGYGYFMTGEQVRHDIELFRNMNLNVLRSRPVPMQEYLDACDELGMYTTVEGMFTLMMYDKGPTGDHGADPSVGPGLREHLAAMLESTRSSPSILIYGLGNENPYYDYFREAAAAMQSEQTGVPLFFGSDARDGVDIDFMDVNDDHYPRDGTFSLDDPRHIRGQGWEYPADRPIIFSEWGHIPALDIKEYLFDPGVDDYWGYVAEAHVDWSYDTPHVLGGFLFLGAPEVKIGATFPWRGFFDAYRRPYDMAYHVRKSNSPVRIEDPTLRAEVEVVNRHDFTNLKELEAHWEQDGERGVARLDVPPRQTRTVGLPVDPDGGPVALRFVNADGGTVDEYRLTRPDQRPRAELPETPGGEMSVEEGETGVTVTVGEATFGFDADGLLVRGDLDGEPILEGRPEVVARPTQFERFRGNQKRSLVNQCMNWTADDVDVQRGENRVTVTARGRYTMAEGAIVTTIRDDGRVEVAYDLAWTGGEPFKCFDWGYALRVAPDVDTLRWTRKAQWSVYPPDAIGRPQGIAPAAGDPRHASARAAYADGRKPWPWSQDVLDGVTNEFRGTKFRLITGGLYRGDGPGVSVVGRDADAFADSQHLRASPVGGDIAGDIFTKEFFPDDEGGYWLEVMEFHGGPHDPHLTKSLTADSLKIEKGTKLAGTVRFALTPEPIEVDESVNFAEPMP